MHKTKELLIKENASVRFAMKKIQVTSKRVLFVVDDKELFLGVINDGDIRRWILNRGDLNSSIKDVYNKNSICLKENFNFNEAKELMLKHWVESIPVISDNGKIKDVVYLSDVFGKKQIQSKKKVNIPVVIMAGGKGTRLDPFTRILPKPLVPVGDKPIIEIIMNQYADYGCSKFYIIVNYKAEMIKLYFDNTKLAGKIKYIYEDKPGGTAGGLKLLPDGVGKNLFVSNCDMLVKENYSDIYDFHIQNNNDITIVGSMQHFKVPYGVIELEEEGRLKGIIEKPEYDHLVNTGMYVIKSDILKYVSKRDGLFHFTHLIKKVISMKGNVRVYPISEKSWLDIGQWSEYKKNLKLFGLESGY